MTDETREQHIIRSFMSFADSLVADFDVLDLTIQLVEDCSALLDVAASGLLLADGTGSLHLLAATTEQARSLEVFQLQSDEGPCLDSYQRGDPLGVPDLRTETERWPRFTAAAQRLGFVSVQAIPMRYRQDLLGALGLFGTRPGTLTAEDLSLAQALAHVASIAIVQHHRRTGSELLAGLHAAVNSRGVLELAKGVVAESCQVDLGEAFQRLRGYSRRHGHRLSELAHLVAFGEPPIRRAVLAELTQPGTAAEQRPAGR
jgi:GAF domain-containing protein